MPNPGKKGSMPRWGDYNTQLLLSLVNQVPPLPTKDIQRDYFPNRTLRGIEAKLRFENDKAAGLRTGTTTSSRNSESAGKRKRRSQPNIREVTPEGEDTDTDRDSGDISPSGRRSPMRGSAKKQRDTYGDNSQILRPVIMVESCTHPQSAGEANPPDISIRPSGISVKDPVIGSSFNPPEPYAADIEIPNGSATDAHDSAVAPMARLPSTEQGSLPRDPVQRQSEESLNTASIDRDDVGIGFSNYAQPREQSHNATHPTTGSDRSMTPQQIGEFDGDDSQRADLTTIKIELGQSNTPSSKDNLDVSQKLIESTLDAKKALDTFTRLALDEIDGLQVRNKSLAEKLDISRNEREKAAQREVQIEQKATDSIKTREKEIETLKMELKALAEKLAISQNEIERYREQAAKRGEQLEHIQKWCAIQP
ncbi:hypothetical protein C8Q69DRAFT_495166 [Paecilomyces variotii]|uniref:Uncharacterized protein n=1 Tax=Byssochlamys spectabilis TaxID=264951 RepID=A0A443I746_BYSSP|nr:hypothetical protein C8Q69DRAFT_495166 [Paecilomyces variotii]KAJ9350463.1 hypothetical protein DTO280E4_8665 [Paecilomyces variotii]RWQ99877.1 hypothetical protein C8Q69DRAFT_495166 [Paecilomyces variotii]